MVKIKIHRNLAKLKNIDLFYLDTRTEGSAILCLHGRWGRAETWVDFMERYGQQYRIIAPDQRGHGLSGKPASNYTAEEMAEDMVELLDELKIESVLVAGHSMGGRVAGYLTALYPEYVKALAILDRSASGLAKTGTPPSDPFPAVDPLTRDWPLPFSSLSEAMNFIRKFTDSELSYQYFMNSLVETVEGYRMQFSSHAMAAGMAHDVDWFHLLPEIQCPVLLIRAKRNDAVSDEDFFQMQSLLPHCVAREVSHPDHNVHLANKEEFYGYFDEFLKIAEGWLRKCD
ncbi:alpha/beta hydrolase [Paenibacillus sp. 7124]|uniref:Alpha/beta hydrolase n=1 Tax=Paenibacillus apii TaxID=1850370 RepID=A0A6M1PNJ5_9BACL|nr:alpha/beta hydrolase [Paenibacillus apii]NGM84084.1 alpha/beta hydrolase [Paenibacillus apii]NJJ38736.1 alpha/beta hydrolase [Paenibacillus apii]